MRTMRRQQRRLDDHAGSPPPAVSRFEKWPYSWARTARSCWRVMPSSAPTPRISERFARVAQPLAIEPRSITATSVPSVM